MDVQLHNLRDLVAGSCIQIMKPQLVHTVRQAEGKSVAHIPETDQDPASPS